MRHYPYLDPPRRWAPALLAMLVATATCPLAGCSAVVEKAQAKPVCKTPTEQIVIVPQTSKSDLEMSQQIVPKITDAAIDRAVESCGLLAVGLMGGSSAAQELSLEIKRLSPEKTTTFGDREAVLDPTRETARKFVADHLTSPLAAAEARGGSPYLNGLAQIAAELKAHDLKELTILLVGDGLAVEAAPGRARINFYATPIDLQAVMRFAPLLKPLEGSCVILVSSAMPAGVSDEQLRDARGALQRVLEKAGAQFVSTAGTSDIPWTC